MRNQLTEAKLILNNNKTEQAARDFPTLLLREMEVIIPMLIQAAGFAFVVEQERSEYLTLLLRTIFPAATGC
jgi:hypothetical protein